MDKGTGEMVAIKIIPICDEDNEDELTKIVREIDHLKKCDSPYVTAYYGSYFRNKRLWVRALLSLLFFVLLGVFRFRSLASAGVSVGLRGGGSELNSRLVVVGACR
jgi:serine/threonine protein kinase